MTKLSQERLSEDSSKDQHQTRPLTYSDVLPVCRRHPVFWVQLLREIITLVVYIRVRDHQRELQADMIANHIAKILLQHTYVLCCVCYIGGQLYYEANPTVQRNGIWADNTERTLLPSSLTPKKCLYWEGTHASARRSRRRGSYLQRRLPPLQCVRDFVPINRALNRLGRTLVHRAFLDARAKNKGSLPALGKRAVPFRQLKGLFRTFQPTRSRLTHDEYKYLRSQLGGQHASEALAQLRTMSGGGSLDAGNKELFLLYLARLDQLPQTSGGEDRMHQAISVTEFKELSRHKKLLLFHDVGLHASTLDTVKRFFRKDDPLYPDTHTDYNTPAIELTLLNAEEVLHHHRHVEEKIKRLKKISRGLHKESKDSYRAQLHHASITGHNITPTAGYSRMDNIMSCNQAIVQHTKLLGQLQRLIKKGMQTHKVNLPTVYLHSRDSREEPADNGRRKMAVTNRTHRCRRHFRKLQVQLSGDNSSQDQTIQEETSCSPIVQEGTPDIPLPLLEQMNRKKKQMRINLASNNSTRLGQDEIGGFLSTQPATGETPAGQLKVATFNVTGLTREKLDLLLQYMDTEKIDVLSCIDAQLSQKAGRAYGKLVKLRLGPGTVTHCSACLPHFGGTSSTPYRKVGGIFMIIGPRWGPSHSKFVMDSMGPGGGTAGVLAKTTLSTAEGDVTIMASYWPIAHTAHERSDQNLWNCLTRYIQSHNQADKDPTALMGRMVRAWSQTAIKNGSRGLILTGDFNASWRHKEHGGQFALKNWAEEYSFYNGPLRVAEAKQLCFYTRGDTSHAPSWIDHILHKGPSTFLDFKGAFVGDSTDWEGFSDHRPLSAVFTVPMPSQVGSKKTAKVQVRYELDVSDKRMCEAFTAGMTDIHIAHPCPDPTATLEEKQKYINYIERASGKLVKQLHKSFGIGKKRSSHKDGWSPLFTAHKAHLDAIVEIKRFVMGYRNHPKWLTVTDMQKDMPHIIELWDWALSNPDLTEEQIDELELVDGKGRQWWLNLTQLPLLEDCDSSIDTIKHKLHGRQRSDMRMQMNTAVRKREKLRKQGKWRTVIKSLLGILAGRRHQDGVNLDILKTATGKCTTSPEEVHTVATDGLRQWFSSPEAQRRGIHTADDWERALTDRTYFLDATEFTGVPLDIRETIFEAMSNVDGQREAELLMAEAFSSVPTFAEWQDTIKMTHNNSSGGMSGCSYNQLKHWPVELSRDVYATVAACWQDKSIPIGWKWRWLVPIPKKPADIPSINDLRPLILVEAVRKVWSKLVLQKLKTVWKEVPLLNSAQHGYSAHLSTMTASLLHINLLEDAMDRNNELHTSSYDLSKAFDSVSKNVMRMAWRRLGVPTEIVEWLVEMDIKGVTVVRTPFAAQEWDKHTYHAVQLPVGSQSPLEPTMSPVEALLEAFTAERGTGQGDVTSPTCWLALFDILLLALHRDNLSRHTTRLVRRGGNISYAAHETAYADDMHAGSYTATDIQRKADIVSGFCVIMGLEISVTKLRRFVWAATGSSASSCPDMTIRGLNWEATPIPVASQGCLTYLGGLYDLKRRDSTALQEIKEVAVTHCAEVGATRASSVTKVACASLTTVNKVRYKAKLTSASLDELRGVDKIFYKFHKSVSKNMAGFPCDLMYLPSTVGGVGISRFSDQVQMDKLGMLLQGIASGGDLAAAAEGLIHRASRHTDSAIPAGYAMQIHSKKRKRYWTRSVLEWLEEAHLTLCRGGRRSRADELQAPIIQCFPSLTTDQAGILNRLNIKHIGDLVAVSDNGTRSWFIPPQASWLASLVPPTPPQDDSYLLWPGQTWLISNNAEDVDNVAEIVDILSDSNIRIRRWLRDSQGQTSYTAGAYEHCRLSQLFEPTALRAVRVNLSRTGRQTGTVESHRSTCVPRVSLAHAEHIPDWATQVVDWIAKAPAGFVPCIHTDGSYNEGSLSLASIFDDAHKTISATAGLIIMHDGPDWRDFPTCAIHIKDGDKIQARSAYSMEFIALAAALRLQELGISTTPVCTDAAAVVRTIRNRHRHLLKPDCSHRVLLQSINRSIENGSSIPKWVRGHPEKRQPDKNQWNVEECGNHMADRVAANCPNSVRNVCRGNSRLQHAPVWITIEAADLHKDCIRDGDYYWGDASGAPACLNGLLDTVYHRRLQEYLTHRDANRDGPARWLDGTYRLAAAVFNGKDRNIATVAQSSRIIYNKHWHGGNRAKKKTTDETERILAMQCHLCGDIDSQDHLMQHCTHNDVTIVRRATVDTVEALCRHHGQESDDATSTLHIKLIDGIKGMLTGDTPGRIWTSNWSCDMIKQLQAATGIQKVNKKLHAGLKYTLEEVGKVFADGAREICRIRHSITELHNREASRAVYQNKVAKKVKGRQPTLQLWLRTGILAEKRASKTAPVLSGYADTSAVSPSTIVDISQEHKLQQEHAIRTEITPCQVLRCIDNVPITAATLRAVLSTGEINDEAVNGYMRLLNRQKHDTGSYAMSTYFFQLLHNPSGLDTTRPSGCFDFDRVHRHTRHIDIFSLKHLTVPVYLGTGRSGHWTLLNADMTRQEVRYYDSNGGSGRQYAEVLLQYLKEEWRRKKTGSLPSTWTCHGSDADIVPQQGHTLDCAVFAMLIAHALHYGIAVHPDTLRINGAIGRRHIAHCLLNGILHSFDGLRVSTIVDLSGQEARVSTSTRPKRVVRAPVESYIPPNGHNGNRMRSIIGDYRTEENYGKLEIKDWGSAGLGLFSKERLMRNTWVGCYEGSDSHSKDDGQGHLDYILEHQGIVRDAWNSNTQTVSCLVGFVNDPLDKRKINTRWVRRMGQGGTWTIWLQTTRDIQPGEQLFVQYNAARWCRQDFHIDTLTAAIRTYDIDLLTSTEDTNGYWRGLPGPVFDTLLARQQTWLLDKAQQGPTDRGFRPTKRMRPNPNTISAYLTLDKPPTSTTTSTLSGPPTSSRRKTDSIKAVADFLRRRRRCGTAPRKGEIPEVRGPPQTMVVANDVRARAPVRFTAFRAGDDPKARRKRPLDPPKQCMSMPCDSTTANCQQPQLPLSAIDRFIALASTRDAGWITDTVIHDYFGLLRDRSRLNNTNCAFLSPHFFNRLVNMHTRTFRPQFSGQAQNGEDGPGSTAWAELAAMHDFDDIFQYTRVYVPVNHPVHWGLLEIDNTVRTITYLDSLYDGGEDIATLMEVYLMAYEDSFKGHTEQWQCRGCTTSTQPSNRTRVSRQQNGDDCGVYVCVFADLLERNHSITDVQPHQIPTARKRLAQSIRTLQALQLESNGHTPSNEEASTTGTAICNSNPQPGSDLEVNLPMTDASADMDYNSTDHSELILGPNCSDHMQAEGAPGAISTHRTLPSSQITTTGISAGQPSIQNILVLGMLYGNDDSTTKGQLGRDYARCRALEAMGPNRVYSTDLTHSADMAQPGRHIQHDFGTYGVLSAMDSSWPGIVFGSVIMDYFYTPNSWHEEHWKEEMYTTTLRTLAKHGALRPGCEIWLPNIRCIRERLDRLRPQLASEFDHEIQVSDPLLNPLFDASQRIDDTLKDIGTFNNFTALKDLHSTHPFILLRCRDSAADRLPTEGCGKLSETILRSTTYSLRMKNPSGTLRTIKQTRKLSIARWTKTPHSTAATSDTSSILVGSRVDDDMEATVSTREPTTHQEFRNEMDGTITTAEVPTLDRAKRATRNLRAQYDELSPKKIRKLRRLPHIKPSTCKLAIGPSQQYDGGLELYLDQPHCKKGTIIAYYEGEQITAAEKDLRESRYIFAIPTGEDSEIYIDAANPMSGYARYADDSLLNGTENAVFSTIGHGSDTRLALIAIDDIVKGTPIRATYGWQYWNQPKIFALDLMRKAFSGYIEEIGADDDVQGAWEFAAHVGGTDALLGQWRGIRKHELESEEEQGDEDEGSQAQCPDTTNEGQTQHTVSATGVKRKRSDLSGDCPVLEHSACKRHAGMRQDIIHDPSRLESWITSIQGAECPQEVQVGTHAKGCPPAAVDRIIQALRGNTRIHALYFQGMGVSDRQLVALLEVMQTTRIYALNLGETTLTLQGLRSLKTLLPSTNITALYIDHTPHNRMRMNIKEACWNNRGKRDLLYAETGGQVRKWHHIPGGRPALTKTRVTARILARKPTVYSRSARSAKTSTTGSSEEDRAEQADGIAPLPCLCLALQCRCIPPAIFTQHLSMDCIDKTTSVDRISTPGAKLDNQGVTTTRIDSAGPTLVEEGTKEGNKRTREARGWGQRAELGSRKKRNTSAGDCERIIASPGRRTRLRDIEAGEEREAIPDGGSQE